MIYEVLSGDMHRDGYKFYLSVNKVWLAKEVPLKYLRKHKLSFFDIKDYTGKRKH